MIWCHLSHSLDDFLARRLRRTSSGLWNSSEALGLEAKVLTLDRFEEKIQEGTLIAHRIVGRNDGDDDYDIKHTKCLITTNKNNC